MSFVTAAIIGSVGAVAGGAIAAHGASSAANTAAKASDQAAQLQYQLGEDQLAFNRGVYGNAINLEMPWLTAGNQGLTNLQYLMGLSAPPSSTVNAEAGGYRPATTLTAAPGGFTATPQVFQAGADALARNQGGGTVTDASGNVIGRRSGPQTRLPGGDTLADNISALNPPPGTNFGTPYVPTVASGSTVNGGVPQVSLPAATPNTSLGDFGSLMQPFQAPTDVTEQNDPGYQFRLAQGMKAIQQSAAARGGLLTGGTAKALNDYAQGQASDEYQNVYNRAYNTFETNQANRFNRLAAIAGIGQTGTAQLLGAGNSAAGIGAGIAGNIGGQVGSSLQNAGASRASGYAATGNIFGNAIGGSTNNLANMIMLQQLFGAGNPGVMSTVGSVSPNGLS